MYVANNEARTALAQLRAIQEEIIQAREVTRAAVHSTASAVTKSHISGQQAMQAEALIRQLEQSEACAQNQLASARASEQQCAGHREAYIQSVQEEFGRAKRHIEEQQAVIREIDAEKESVSEQRVCSSENIIS